MKKSLIRKIKKRVFEVVEDALAECALQHEAHGEPCMGPTGEWVLPSQKGLEFSNMDPALLKLTLTFVWPDAPTKVNGKGTEMYCAPVIDLAPKRKKKL